MLGVNTLITWVGMPAWNAAVFLTNCFKPPRSLSGDERENASNLALNEKFLELRSKATSGNGGAEYLIDYKNGAIYQHPTGSIFLTIPKNERLEAGEKLEFEVVEVDAGNYGTYSSAFKDIIGLGDVHATPVKSDSSFFQRTIPKNFVDVQNARSKFIDTYSASLQASRLKTTANLEGILESYRKSATAETKSQAEVTAKSSPDLVKKLRTFIIDAHNTETFKNLTDGEVYAVCQAALGSESIGGVELEHLLFNKNFHDDVTKLLTVDTTQVKNKNQDITIDIATGKAKQKADAGKGTGWDDPVGLVGVGCVASTIGWCTNQGWLEKTGMAIAALAGGIFFWNTWNNKTAGVTETLTDAGKGIADWVGTKASSLLPKHEALAAAPAK